MTDKTHLSQQEIDRIMAETFGNLLAQFSLGSTGKRPTEEMLAWYQPKLPWELLEFWKRYGMQSMGDGFIQIIDPSDYMDSLYTWLGGVDYSKIPIAISGFGDIYYCRSLDDGYRDFSRMNIHYRRIDVICETPQQFFGSYLLDPEVQETQLYRSLFAEALKLRGALAPGECFFFVPALVLGGAVDIRFVQKGHAAIHQDMLFQMGKQG